MEHKEICSTYYFSLYSNGEIGCSDGVGFCGEVDKSEAIEFIKKAYEFFKQTGDIA